ncbi:hypothetical protein GCM10010429_33370 [Micromonospora olivasterospora]|uniref:Uncharacterized protein n=1 Tax=Micromonospora olivasterospora TaxID=1880 RepID=A0A562IA53_MICOL|nr:hypothetical protein JD77_02916 [Micromonospora olivasterospora]
MHPSGAAEPDVKEQLTAQHGDHQFAQSDNRLSMGRQYRLSTDQQCCLIPAALVARVTTRK